MADVNKHNVFPTSLYNFEHKFENDELKTLVDHIQTKSIMDKDGEVVRRNGSQLENELHKLDIFSNLVKTIIEVTKTIMEDKNYESNRLANLHQMDTEIANHFSKVNGLMISR